MILKQQIFLMYIQMIFFVIIKEDKDGIKLIASKGLGYDIFGTFIQGFA